MEFEDLLNRRRCIRRFEDRPIEPGKIQAVLEAADGAPSAGDIQAYEIVCVTDQSTRTALAQSALGQEFVGEAPAVLVFFANPSRASATYGLRGADLYCVQDATIACAFAHLRAADVGLGSVWVGAFNEEGISRAVSAPDGLRPVALLAMGYPAESPSPTPRRGLEDLVKNDKF